MILGTGLVISSGERGFRTWIRPGGDVCTTITKATLALDPESFRAAFEAHREQVAAVVGRRARRLTRTSAVLRVGIAVGTFASMDGLVDLRRVEATIGYALALVATALVMGLFDMLSRRLATLALRRLLDGSASTRRAREPLARRLSP